MSEVRARGSHGTVVCTGSTLGRRSTNQDRVALGGNLVAVADGVGGGRRGDLAAQVAVGALLVESSALGGVEGDGPIASDELVAAMRAAHQRVVEASERVGGLCETTLSAAHVGPDDDGWPLLTVGWVGDSPVFVADADGVAEITTSHEIVGPDGRSGLARALGSRRAEPDVLQRRLAGRTRVVLASDGIRCVAEARLQRHIGDLTCSAQECVDAVLAAVEESGGRDNTTVAVIDVVGDVDVDRTSWTLPIAGLR